MICDVSFQVKEARASPKRRLDGRLSRTSSTEREPASEPESNRESDENKENCRLDHFLNDQDSWNESVISGTSVDSEHVGSDLLYLPFNVQSRHNLSVDNEVS